MEYYIGIQGVQSGPFTESIIREKLARGEFPADALCWAEGWPAWRSLSATFPSDLSQSARPPGLPPAHYPPIPAQPVHSGPPTTSGLAITSLVLGVIGLIAFIPALPAVICGHIACSNIKSSGGKQTGRGMAIAGLVLGYIIIALFPVGLLAAMAVPAFQKVRSASQEKTVINNLRQLDSAAEQFMLENGTKQASYSDLVGPDRYIPSLNPIVGEDYSDLVIRQNDRSISVTTSQGRVITYTRHYTSSSTSFAPETP
ncbi:MAG: DUF4190 domain-containing protein [Rariglobus sp.]